MALLPPAFLKSVVSIEVIEGQEAKCRGTGFLLFRVYNKEGERYSGQLFLVTAAHVLIDIERDGFEKLYLRFDKNGEAIAQKFSIPTHRAPGLRSFFCPESGKDVAVIPLDKETLEENEIDFVSILDTETGLRPEQFDEVGLSVGDEIFFLGFPLGMRGENKNYAICRSGIIARRDPELAKNSILYLDAPVFPGNSGGPVFCKPQVVSIQGTKSINRAYLIGIATHYYWQTKHSEAAMTENKILELVEGHLGLSKIVTLDAVYEAIGVFEKALSDKEVDISPSAPPAE
ncbi:MAG: serine protease [Patescibacteria group bacterium]|jgi:hypothetical protein